MIKIITKKVAVAGNLEYPVVMEFPVLMKGWEMDDDGYIIKVDGVNRFLWSNHGALDLVPDSPGSDDPTDVMILNNLIADYEDVIEKTREAIYLLELTR